MSQPYSTENTTAGKLQYLLSTYYDKLLLETLYPQTHLYQLCQKRPIPQGEGKIVKFSRYTAMDTPGAALTEGSAPSPVALSAVNVTATIEQFGATRQISDLIQLTSISHIVQDAVYHNAKQAAITIDTHIRNEAIFGTSAGAPSSTDQIVPSPDGQAARDALQIRLVSDRLTISGITSSDTMTAAEMNRILRDLRKRNAPAFPDGYYVMVAHPQVVSDLMGDSTAVTSWAAWNEYTTPEAMYKGEVGRVFGFRVLQSTNMWSFSSGAGSSTSAYCSIAVGPDALGCVEIGGKGGVETHIVTGADHANPLDQWTSVGWKATFTSVVLNPSCGIVSIVGAAS